MYLFGTISQKQVQALSVIPLPGWRQGGLAEEMTDIVPAARQTAFAEKLVLQLTGLIWSARVLA